MKISTSNLPAGFRWALPVLFMAAILFSACEEENVPKLGSVKFVFSTEECDPALAGTVSIQSKTASVRTESASTAECSRFNPGEKINLEPGTYQYLITSDEGRTWEGSVTVSDGTCEIVTIGCPVTTGLATFWLDQDFGCGSVFVDIPGYETQEIYSYSPGSTPACGDAGFANFELEAGTYSYTAYCSNRSWQGEVSISRNRCKTVLLSAADSEGQDEYGQAVFWINQDFGCGYVTVTVSNQYSETISTFYSSGSPDCGEDGSANFSLAPGTYTYQASCTGYTWPQYSFTVYANECVSTMIQ